MKNNKYIIVMNRQRNDYIPIEKAPMSNKSIEIVLNEERERGDYVYENK